MFAQQPKTMEDDSAIDWSSWDPSKWGIDGGGVPLQMFPVTPNRFKRSKWSPLCISKPVLGNMSKTYKVVTGPEDPKLFMLPTKAPFPGWGMLFSSVNPVELAGGPSCHSSSTAVSQMYVAIGEKAIIVNGNSSNSGDTSNTSNTSNTSGSPGSTKTTIAALTAGVRLECGRSGKDEKNWIPFVRSSQQYFVYSIVPHKVLQGRPTDGVCLQRWSTLSYSPLLRLAEEMSASRLHGSATAVLFGGGKTVHKSRVVVDMFAPHTIAHALALLSALSVLSLLHVLTHR